MTAYRFLAYDLRTNALLGEVPLSGIKYGHKLNAAGTLTGSLTLGRRTVAGTVIDGVLLAMIEPMRTAIYVERDGVLVWGGILWDHGDYDSTTRTVNVSCAEFWSYFSKRRLRVDMDIFPAQDQFVITRSLITYAQGITGGNIGITLDATTSGITRDPTYNAYERRRIADIITEMSSADDGFDFSIDVNVDGSGLPTRTLNLANKRGRSASDTGLVFEVGKNIGSYKWPRSGSSAANSWDGLGNGEGDAMLISTITRTELIDAGYPIVDDVVSYKSIDDPDLLDGKTRSVALAKGLPIVSPVLVDVFLGGDPPFGSWIMGDYARFRVEDDERFPRQADGSAGLDTYVRIIADEVSVADSGVETVDLTVEASNG